MSALLRSPLERRRARIDVEAGGEVAIDRPADELRIGIVADAVGAHACSGPQRLLELLILLRRGYLASGGAQPPADLLGGLKRRRARGQIAPRSPVDHEMTLTVGVGEVTDSVRPHAVRVRERRRE